MYVCMYRYCLGYIDFDISQIYIYNLWCLHLRHLIATGLGLGIVFFFFELFECINIYLEGQNQNFGKVCRTLT